MTIILSKLHLGASIRIINKNPNLSYISFYISGKKCFRMANLIQKNLQLWSVRNFSLTSAFNCKAFITKEKDPVSI